MTLDLSDRHALISGAGSGIGAAIALALAQQGCVTGASHRNWTSYGSAATLPSPPRWEFVALRPS